MKSDCKQPGRQPFGTSEPERDIINLIRLKRRSTKSGRQPSLNSIANDLNAQGYRTKMGRLWQAQTVKNVLAASDKTAGGKSAKKVKKTGLETGDYLNREQLGKLFETARAGLYSDEMIIAVMVGSGLRASELCALQVRDLGIYGGKSQIDVRRGKGAKQRCVFISEALSAALRDHLRGIPAPKKSPVFVSCSGGPLRYGALYKRIKRMGDLAGLPELHPHTLRHTFGTFLYHYRKDLFFVKQQLGHSKVDTTQIYAKTLTESKLEQVNALGAQLSELMKAAGIPDTTSKLEQSP